MLVIVSVVRVVCGLWLVVVVCVVGCSCCVSLMDVACGRCMT